MPRSNAWVTEPRVIRYNRGDMSLPCSEFGGKNDQLACQTLWRNLRWIERISKTGTLEMEDSKRCLVEMASW